MKPSKRDLTRTVIIENMAPAVDGGRYAVKREVGERVANMRFLPQRASSPGTPLAGPQAYFIRLGLGWVCAMAAVDK